MSYVIVENELFFVVYCVFYFYFFIYVCYLNFVCLFFILLRVWSWEKGFINRINDIKMQFIYEE